MAMRIPTDTFFSYNSVTFPVTVKTKVVEEPITSGDNRVVKWSKITISAAGYITQADADAMAGALAPGLPLDTLMLSIRRKLQVHQKILRYVNRGYGRDLNIGHGADIPLGSPLGNTVSIPAIRDVAMGPKAGKFTWWPLGGAPDGCHGAGFEWEISTCIAECGQFAIVPGVFMEISFTVTYDTDEAGIVTITYHGMAQIPMSLRSDNTLDFNIDSQIQLLINPPPDGFIRRQSRQLSADRTACTFTITDRQLEVPYPLDVVHCDIKHRIRQTRPYSPTWDATISGTVRIQPTASKQIAWGRFMNIAAQRMAYARRHAVIANGAVPVEQPANNAIATANGRRGIVQGIIEMEEDLFKNEARFTVNYKILGAPLRVVMRVSGLWQPIVNNPNDLPPGQFARDAIWTAALWSESLRSNAQRFRGIAGAQFANNSDIIIDVCAGPVDPTRRVAPAPDVQMGVDEIVAVMQEVDDSQLEEIEPSIMVAGAYDEADDLFAPESSWLEYVCVPRRVVDHRQIRHKPLSGTVQYNAQSKVDAMGLVQALAAQTSNPTAGWSASVDDIVQQISAPSMILRLTGYAVRVAHRVNPPQLITYGGKVATISYEDVTERTLGLSESVTAYRTDWDLIYIIPGAPTSIPLPANPLYMTDGVGGGSALNLQSGVGG